MSDEKDLSKEEQIELFRLLSFKTLLNTRAEDWSSAHNEFVSLAIPVEVQQFVSNFGNPDAVLSGIISDLIIRGISSIARDMRSPLEIDQRIYEIFHKETVQ